MLAVVGLAAVLPCSTADAVGWGAHVEKGSDIIMNDLRWPVWDKGTYYCFWYLSFHPTPYCAVYGGTGIHGARLPGFFTTYWAPTKTLFEGEHFYGKGFGAEGARGGASGNPPFSRPNCWYRMVKRVFPPARNADKETNVGWWIKDVENNKWHTHSILRLPVATKGFSGNSGFVEGLAGRDIPRAFERRLGYARLNGKWYNSELTSRQPSYFKLIEKDTVVRYDSPINNPAPGQKTHVSFPTKQPAVPPLDKPAIKDARAFAWEKQVMVNWRIPTSASPQLGYKLEIFSRSGAQGKAIAVYQDASPYITGKRLDIEKDAKSVRLTVTDIFDQTTSVVIPVGTASLGPAAGASKRREGLTYVYYEGPKDAAWKQLPDLAKLKPVKQGYVKNLDDTIKEDRAALYAINFKGYIRVPRSGLYVFSTGTSDGSRMKIDRKLIADNDGIHSASTKQYAIALTKGPHTFELEYFKGSSKGYPESRKLSISWEGPGFERRFLARTDFLCDADSDAIPSTVLTLKGGHGVLDDTLAKLHASITRRGRRVRKLQLFAGKLLLATRTGADADDKGNIDFSVIIPEGEYKVWTRLWFDEGGSIDSNELELKATNRTVAPWKFSRMEKGDFPLGVRSADGRVSFVGEGFGFVHQTVKGDFTLTAHIADIALTSPENGMHPWNWLGLHLKEKSSDPKKLVTDRGGQSFAVFLTASGQMKGVKDFPDLAGTNMSATSFEGSHRWLRLIRRGQRYQAFTSADGKAWVKAAEHVPNRTSKEVYAGLCFRSVPAKSRSLFQGTLDQITLEHTVAPEVRVRPRKEDLRLENRITALLQANKDPDIMYARSAGKGLFKSKDRGETWAPVNNGLTTPDALAVRSLAVHPKNSSIVLRGGGALVNGALKSGLWKSIDGGKSWRLITRDIGFDGRGPATLFGEVIAFGPFDPNVVVAGGETNGLFLSLDAGETWKCAGLSEERITCMTYGPPPRKGDPRNPTLLVGTFADTEFAALGMDKPVSQLDNRGGVWSFLRVPNKERKLMPRLRRDHDMEQCSVTNIAHGSAFLNIATTRGIYYRWNAPIFSQRMHKMPADVLFTAIGGRRQSDNAWSKLICVAPFSAKEQSPVYLSQDRSRHWKMLSPKSNIQGGEALRLNAGISCIAPDSEKENSFYLCNIHGIFKATDNGKSYKLVKSAKD